MAVNKNFIMIETPIEGLRIAERKVFHDNRGGFSKLFCADEFQKVGIKKPVEQVNYSVNLKKGTVRGLHFQYPPDSEIKIVTCLKGEIFDVAVDLRHGSDTFLRWHGEKLSPCNLRSLIIPEGFAHGFQTLTDNCELLYVHTGLHIPGSEGGFNVKDGRIAISWPLPFSCLSERDKNLPFIEDNYKGVVL